MIDTKPEKLPVFRKGKYITPGVTKYKDGRSFLLRKETIDRMAQTFRGCPVNVMHDGKKCGAVIGYPEFCEADNWFYVPYMVETQEGLDAESKPGYSLSCTWEVLAYGTEAGTYAGVSYDKEILEARYTELAITPDPHYEEADIIRNGGESMKKEDGKEDCDKAHKDEVVVKNSSAVPLKKIYFMVDGEKVSANDIIVAYEDSLDADIPETEFSEDESFDVEEGDPVSVKDMIEVYRKTKGAKMANSEKTEEKKDEEKDDKKVDNAKVCNSDEPEAAEHTALIAQALKLLDEGKVDEAKTVLASVEKKEAAEIQNSDEEKKEDKKEEKQEEKEEKVAIEKHANSNLKTARLNAQIKTEEEAPKTYETNAERAKRLGF